jgi:hypothetical protein
MNKQMSDMDLEHLFAEAAQYSVPSPRPFGFTRLQSSLHKQSTMKRRLVLAWSLSLAMLMFAFVKQSKFQKSESQSWASSLGISNQHQLYGE